MSNSDLGFKNLRQIIEENQDQYMSIDNSFHYATWHNYSNKKIY
jgi:hypothetical protein